MLNIVETFAVGVALAVDAMIFSFTYGLVQKKRRLAACLSLALSVGLFQALMPLLGYAGGLTVRDIVSSWDHWIVLAVFGAMGGMVIRNAWKGEDEEEDVGGGKPLGFLGLLMVGVATSIDALAVGVCMAIGSMCGTNLTWAQVFIAVGLIGTITFCASVGTFNLAKLLHRLPRRELETCAGLLLIVLGVQNFIMDAM